MVNIKELSLEILENKINNKFPINDLLHEFSLLKKEVIEAEEVLNDKEKLPAELADIVIFVISIARIQGIDLEKAIINKVEYNKNRSYKAGTFRLEDPIDKLYENDYDEIKRIVESDFFKKDNHSKCLLH